MRKSRFTPGLAAIGFFFLIIPVTAAIAASIWLSAAAAYENVKFARGTDQILALISNARDAAVRDPRFGQQPNEDLVDDLIRLGQYRSRPGGAWGGVLRGTVASPSFMRIEIDLTSRACQRLAVFFSEQADDVALQMMASREWNSSWRLFYNATTNQVNPSLPAINAACGDGQHATLALTVRLR